MSGFELPARFWAKVDQRGYNQCWPWTAAKDEKGYGLFRYQGHVVRASRLLLISLGHDMIGRVGRHTCDNPPCCNPNHGIPGTTLDNVRDCVARGRRAQSQGSKNNFAKLDERSVIEIRREYEALPKSPKGYARDGEAQRIAQRFGTTYRNLMGIINRQTWTHI